MGKPVAVKTRISFLGIVEELKVASLEWYEDDWREFEG